MPGIVRMLPIVAFSLLFVSCDINLLSQSGPYLSNANGAAVPAGPVGSQVVLRGGGFQASQGAGFVLFTPSGGGAPIMTTIASASDWTQAVIVTTVPATAAPGSYIISVQANGFTSGGLIFTVTPAATFTPSALTWTAGPNLPSALSGAGVAFAQMENAGYVYAVGGAGAGGTPVATVSYAAVNSNGTLGAWNATTALPTALAFPAAVAATVRNSSVSSVGFLYAIGGSTSAAGTPVNTVYRAPLNANGTIGAWTTDAALPTALRSVGAVVQYGTMFVVGGATNSNAPAAVTYRSPVQPSGSLGWIAQTALPSARARFGFGVAGLYLYAIGGDSIALAPGDTTGGAKRIAQILYAKINPSTSVLGSWTANTNALALGRSAETAVPGFGSVLVVGGLYSGASSHASEAAYAAIAADGSIGTFTTAAPATSINSVCGCNLFNHGSTGYIAGNGSYHVLIVGGDDVNANGTPRAETYTY